MSYARDILAGLDRRDLFLAVWSSEFVRALDGVTDHGAAATRRIAEAAAKSADRAVEALRLLEVTFEPVDAIAAYMPWEAFRADCQTTLLTDDDGFGELATADQRASNIRVYPSDALDEGYVRPDWAPHVCWYNK